MIFSFNAFGEATDDDNNVSNRLTVTYRFDDGRIIGPDTRRGSSEGVGSLFLFISDIIVHRKMQLSVNGCDSLSDE
jgi:hypothetical protein